MKPLSLDVIVRGAEKAFHNAEQLFHEAELLSGAGAVARALCLHQISLEECSKVTSLGMIGTGLMAGISLDQKKALRAMTQHAAKNKSNAYMLDSSPDEGAAVERGDLSGALAAFKATQTEFHHQSNNAKNAALYVDLVGEEFLSPQEQITAEMLAETRERNAVFLGYAWNSVKLLRRMAQDPSKMGERFNKMKAELDRLGPELPQNPAEVLEKLILNMAHEKIDV